ncbi:MAG: ferrous iron transport protein A [Elusimicrobiota bacterium]|jgi:Fe2+ transport system protein FeoA|nr:ferrous iron transport protein A [Elusimicrobiota bacterium]
MSDIKKLSQLKAGDEGQIKSISSQAETLKKRLLDMGCVAGCTVKVTKLAPLGDPIEILIKNYNLSLRKAEAEQISVEVI